jgi:sugar phosphate isomerase/epimerase
LKRPPITRRTFHARALGGLAVLATGPLATPADSPPFRLRYIVASCLYGKVALAEILPEVRRCGAEHIEIWSEPHGNQREQIDAMGLDACAALLREHAVKLGSITCFKQGIFNMREEMQVVKRLGGDMVICNSGGPKDLSGDELKSEVGTFAEKLKPHVAHAEDLGINLGLENHSGGLINSPESQRRLLDLIRSPRFGIALAPAHLPQEPEQIAALIEQLGDRLMQFQAWGKGKGFVAVELPPEEQRLQLPHRGAMDWTPIVGALKRISYAGRVEVFMHPTPRGVPILDTTADVTAEINRAREHLETCLVMAR